MIGVICVPVLQKQNMVLFLRTRSVMVLMSGTPEERVDPVSDSRSQRVEDQIVDVRSSGGEKQLQAFYAQRDQRACRRHLPETVQLSVYGGQNDAAGNEHRRIALPRSRGCP